MAASHPAFYIASCHQLDEFDTIVDVRSPTEYADDHIPGAINCPVLSDAERATVGTAYSQDSPFEARKLGAALVTRNIARHLETDFRSKPKSWKPLVYCWRGGQRSGALATVLCQVGWSARQLEGGYKAFRRRVMTELATRARGPRFTVLCGPTGSGKTALLQALSAAGEQVLDLEALAQHKGSVLGGDPVTAQPGQKAFETRLWDALGRIDSGRTVWVESESRRIGRLSLPDALIERLLDAPCVALTVPLEARVAHLCERYADLLLEPRLFKLNLERLTPLHGRKAVAEWKTLVDQSQWSQLARELVERHYDPAYRRVGRTLYRRVVSADRIELTSLGASELACAARRLAGRAPSP